MFVAKQDAGSSNTPWNTLRNPKPARRSRSGTPKRCFSFLSIREPGGKTTTSLYLATNHALRCVMIHIFPPQKALDVVQCVIGLHVLWLIGFKVCSCLPHWNWETHLKDNDQHSSKIPKLVIVASLTNQTTSLQLL